MKRLTILLALTLELCGQRIPRPHIGVPERYPMPIIASGLIGRYEMNNAFGSTLPDTSGAGNPGTLSQPPVISGGGLKFDGALQLASLPGALSSYRTVQVIADFSLVQNYGNFRALIGSNNAAKATLMMNPLGDARGGSLAPSIYANGAYTTTTVSSIARIQVLTLTLDTLDHIYINGVESGYEYNQAASSSLIGGTIQIGGSSSLSYFFKGLIFEVLFYNRALSAAEVTANAGVLFADVIGRAVTVPALPETTGAILSTKGDSITNEYEQLPTGWVDLLSPTQAYTKYNMGINGFQAKFVPGSSPDAAQLISPNGPNVVILYLGPNDGLNGQTAAQCFNNQVLYGQALRAAGARVIVMTMLSWPGLDTFKNTLNGLIRANWTTFADELGDWSADNPILGADGAYANLLYFNADGHPNGNAAVLMAASATGYINDAAPITIVAASVGLRGGNKPRTIARVSAPRAIGAGS